MDNGNQIITELSLPGHISYLPLALCFVEESARLFFSSADGISRIRLAAEEAVSNVIMHGLENTVNQTYKISCIADGSQFAVRILEKGRPYDPESLASYDPERPGEVKGLGTFLMKSVMDEVYFNNLGRGGKETLLIKYISDDKPDFELNKPKQESPKDFTYIIRPFEDKDALKISECAYSAYGYSYEPFIYYPSRIIRMNHEQKLFSYVAVTNEGDIAGHAAIKYDDNRQTAELGVAFVNPLYRGRSVFTDLTEALVKEAYGHRPELKCLFAGCVTGHTGSQKLMYPAGYRTTSLMLALLPSDLNFKSLVGEIKQKESAVTVSKIITEAEPQTVYLPDTDREMILKIYHSLGLNIIVGENQAPAGEPDGDIYSSCVVDVLNCGMITCYAYTEETPSAIKHKVREMCLDNISAVFLYLDMTEPASPFVSEACRKEGFIFAGIKPYGLRGKHSLIMQYLNNLRLDFGRINLADSSAVELKNYIEAQYTAFR